MRTAKLAIGGDFIVLCRHMRDVFGRIDRQALTHTISRTVTAKGHRLRVIDPRLLFMKQTKQQLRRLNGWSDQLKLIDCVEQYIRPVPIFAPI